MTTVVAIPIIRVNCKVWLDKGRPWSIFDELLLWSLSRRPWSLVELARDAGLPRQVVVASIARLMRFRLVEVTLTDDGAAFKTSDLGFRLMSSGNQLPYYPKRTSRRVSFVIERVTGQMFANRNIRAFNQNRIQQEREQGADIRVIDVDGDKLPMTHHANFERLSEMTARNWDEQIVNIEDKSTSIWRNEFMAVRVHGNAFRDLPDEASDNLREIILAAAEDERKRSQFKIQYQGPVEERERVKMFPCRIEDDDLVVGGSIHRDLLVRIIERASSRVIILSTFLDPEKFADLSDHFRTACRRGVKFDILWGAEYDETTEERNKKAAVQIAELVHRDPVMSSQVKVHLRSTGSHAKLLLANRDDGSWTAVVGSCNWLSAPFRAVEVSIVLRDHAVVADVLTTLQKLIGYRGIIDTSGLATELAITCRDLLRLPSAAAENGGEVGIVVGEAHDALIREASGQARRCFMVGSHKLGSVAQPGALMQGSVAAKQENLHATVLFTIPTGPIKRRHARELVKEAAKHGVHLIRLEKIPLHGKFVAWDDDNVIVTSMNWASASTDVNFPWSEVGLVIKQPGIASRLIRTMETTFEEIGKRPAAPPR